MGRGGGNDSGRGEHCSGLELICEVADTVILPAVTMLPYVTGKESTAMSGIRSEAIILLHERH